MSAKSDAAFPLARIIILLLLRGHSAFGEILFARFVKKCPWVVPFYPGRQPVSVLQSIVGPADSVRINLATSTKNRLAGASTSL